MAGPLNHQLRQMRQQRGQQRRHASVGRRTSTKGGKPGIEGEGDIDIAITIQTYTNLIYV